MNHNTTLIGQLKRSLLRFSEKVSDGLTRPMTKFVTAMLYGMLASQSIMLTDISRSLQESISLKKTEDRLSRNLKEFSGDIAVVWDNYLETVNPLIDDDTIFCLDPSDICKKYSRHQEGLSWIDDGSKHKLSMGWKSVGVIALTHKKKLPIPVYNEVLSPHDSDGLTDEIITAIRSTQRTFGNVGIYTMDRGMDTNAIYQHLLTTNQQFIIRNKVNRNLIIGDEIVNVSEIAGRLKGKFRMDYTDKYGKCHKLKTSFISVRLPNCSDRPLSLVAVYGYGNSEPMLLLTNLPIQGKQTCLRVLKTYLCRWRIEEYYRFIKNQFNLENIRVLSLKSIRSLVALVTFLSGWLVMFANKDTMLLAHVLTKALRLSNIPNFNLYAVADGIYNLLKTASRGISVALSKPPQSQQLSLFPSSCFNYSTA